MKDTNKNKGKSKDIILKHGSWIIRKIPYGFALHHVNDTKMHNAVYPSDLAHALQLLYEQSILDKRFSNNYNATIEDLKNAIIETKKEFDTLLSINFSGRNTGELGESEKSRG